MNERWNRRDNPEASLTRALAGPHSLGLRRLSVPHSSPRHRRRRRGLACRGGAPRLGSYRDQALIAAFAYSGCRVGELVRLKVRDFKTSGEHRILNITGKGGKERINPLHIEAVEKLVAWLAISPHRDN